MCFHGFVGCRPAKMSGHLAGLVGGESLASVIEFNSTANFEDAVEVEFVPGTDELSFSSVGEEVATTEGISGESGLEDLVEALDAKGTLE